MTCWVDLVMTLLLRTAIEDAAAATVLAHRRNAMPLAFKTRSKLATSWLVHCVWLGSRRRRTPTAHRPSDDGHEPSRGSDLQ